MVAEVSGLILDPGADTFPLMYSSLFDIPLGVEAMSSARRAMDLIGEGDTSVSTHMQLAARAADAKTRLSSAMHFLVDSYARNKTMDSEIPAVASALRGWNHLRFEITEEPTPSTEGARYSYTPELGIFHAVTGLHDDIMIPEDRLKAAVVKAALGDTTLLVEIDKLLGKPWDDELETFRHAGDGAPVRWLHKVG